MIDSKKSYDVLIDSGHESFIKGKGHVLVREKEIFANLQRRTQIPSFPDSRKRRILHRILNLLVGGVGLWLNVIVLLSALILLIISFIQGLIFHTKDGFTACVFTIVSMFLLMFFLVMAINEYPSIHAKMNYPFKLTESFDELRKQKQIIEGKIISVTIEGPQKNISYNFNLPTNGETITGDYITTADKSFVENNKVAVLYLNPEIHILL